jgi:hypothetical protein
VIDALRVDGDLTDAFEDYQVFEAHFGSRAYNQRDYDNLVTEMYYEAAESLKDLSVISPPDPLEIDLTEREFKFVNRAGKTRKILEPKEDFKKRTGRSPDDGDGFVLAVAPDYCFQKATVELVGGSEPTPATQRTAIEELSVILGV